LDERFERIKNADKAHFHSEVKFLFFDFFKKNAIASLLQVGKEKYSENDFKKDFFSKGYMHGRRFTPLGDLHFNNETDRSIFCYYVLIYFLKNSVEKNAKIEEWPYLHGKPNDYESITRKFIEPIYNYISDNLKYYSSAVYLLNRFKRRTEWFKRNEYYNKYNNLKKNYEEWLTKELMLFLYDNGIEYIISEAKSPSGKSDIIANLNKEDSIVLEVKIFDENKNYGKSYIKKGLNQVIRYAEDYEKTIGYLVIFNTDNRAELKFELQTDNDESLTNELVYKNKTVHFVVINVSPNQPTASKANQLKTIKITEADLLA